jgi:L-threonylcarbamoyladenylate synthase
MVRSARKAAAREFPLPGPPWTLRPPGLAEPLQIDTRETRVLAAFEPGGGARPSAQALSAAEMWLRRGVPVAIPTETVYGLAAVALDRRAVQSIFEIKGRPADNPLIVHVTSEAHLTQVGAAFPPLARELARRFWPGPLTLVVPCTADLPWVTAGLDSIAVRHPAHAFAAGLIERVGPLAAPSANLSGRPSPTRGDHAANELRGRVPLVVDAGELEHGLESTVLDVRGERPVLLRPGALPIEAIEQVTRCTLLGTGDDTQRVRSPGMKYRHYSPRAELWLYPTAESDPSAADALSSDARALQALGQRVAAIARRRVEVERYIPHPEQPQELARRLFGWLNELDELGIDTILVEGIASTGIGRAVMDRLTRAATRVRTQHPDPATERTPSA